MEFTDFPNEIFLIIIHLLEYESEINALCRTSKTLYQRLNPILYENNVHHGTSLAALEWAATNGHVSTAQMAVQAGAPLDVSIESPYQPMMLAAYGGHEAVMRLLYEQGVNPVAKQHWFSPRRDPDSVVDPKVVPFAAAAHEGHESIVRWLLELGLGPDDLEPFDGWALLNEIAARGHLTTLQLMADAGWSMDDPNIENDTPLTSAAEKGHLHVVQFLVERGARADFSARWGPPALCWAAASGHQDTVRYLLDQGVAHDHWMLYALSWASEHDHADVAHLLLDRVDYVQIARDPDQQAVLLCAAAASGCTDFLSELLVKHGYNPNATSTDSRTSHRYKWSALTQAASRGHTETVKLLLAQGADPTPAANDVIDQEFQPLPRAVKNGHEQVVALLLDAGVDPNENDYLSRTLPFKAIPYTPIFRMLLDRGIDPNTTSPGKTSLLAKVLESGNTAVLGMLLDRGVQLGSWLPMSRKARCKVFSLAVIGGEDVFKLLQQYGWTASKEDCEYACNGFPSAAAYGDISMLQLLADQNLTIPDLSSERYNVLYSAAAATACRSSSRAEPEAAVDFLLEHGVGLEAPGRDGGTALGWAVVQGREQAVRILLARGADVFGASGRGTETTLVSAARSQCTLDEHRTIVELLFRNLDERDAPLSDMEEQLHKAAELVEPERAVIKKLFRQYYWRKRYPVPS